MSSPPRTMFVHPVTKITQFYGREVYRERGICFSWTNEQASTWGYEYSKRTVADVVSAVAADLDKFPCPPLTVIEGVPVVRSHDDNPHGLV